MKMNNRGFSLVELIVSMAILVIVGTAILGFFAYSTGQFDRGNRETNLQVEASSTLSRLEERILQTNQAISTNENGTNLVLLQKDDSGNTILTQTISLDTEKHHLTYHEEPGGAEQTFAAYVDQMQVTLYDEKGNKILGDDLTSGKKLVGKVTIELQMSAGDRTYKTEESVAMRNRIVARDTVTE